MKTPTQPPMPTKLVELLRDYPEHLQHLQEILDGFVEPKPRLQPFDEALWSLEDGLSAFIDQAAGELKLARAEGDSAEIARAEAKLRTMFSARSGNVGLGGRSLEGLWMWFEQNKERYDSKPRCWTAPGL